MSFYPSSVSATHGEQGILHSARRWSSWLGIWGVAADEVDADVSVTYLGDDRPTKAAQTGALLAGLVEHVGFNVFNGGATYGTWQRNADGTFTRRFSAGLTDARWFMGEQLTRLSMTERTPVLITERVDIALTYAARPSLRTDGIASWLTYSRGDFELAPGRQRRGQRWVNKKSLRDAMEVCWADVDGDLIEWAGLMWTLAKDANLSDGDVLQLIEAGAPLRNVLQYAQAGHYDKGFVRAVLVDGIPEEYAAELA